MINTVTQLRYPNVINDNERLKQYANKILADNNHEDQQLALDYLSDRIQYGEKDNNKRISDPVSYLSWIVENIKTTKDGSPFGTRDTTGFYSTDLSRTVAQIAATLLPHRIENLSSLSDDKFVVELEKLSTQVFTTHNKIFEKINVSAEREKTAKKLADKEDNEYKRITRKEERIKSGNNAFDRLHEKYPGMSSEDDYFFEAFVTDYADVVLSVSRQISGKQDRDVILKYAQDIELLVKDYMEMLCDKNDPDGRWKDAVKCIKDTFFDSDNTEYRIPRRMAARDRYVVALFFYCKNKSLIDKNSEILFSVFGYDQGYIDKLISSLLPIIEKQIDSKFETKAVDNA